MITLPLMRNSLVMFDNNNNHEILFKERTYMKVTITGNDGEDGLPTSSKNTIIFATSPAEGCNNSWNFYEYVSTVTGGEPPYNYNWTWIQNEMFSGGTKDGVSSVKLAIPSFGWGTEQVYNTSLTLKVTDASGAVVNTGFTIGVYAGPAGNISGNLGYVTNSTQAYTLNISGDNPNTIIWTCSGGTITSGQGTTSISVHWTNYYQNNSVGQAGAYLTAKARYTGNPYCLMAFQVPLSAAQINNPGCQP